jgi:site-specific DNA recombinase
MQNVQQPALPGTAYAYCRVSTDQQRDGYSLGVQLDQCRQRAAADGYTIPDDGAFVEIFTGTAVRRTALDAMLAQMLDDHPSRIYIPKLDRLARTLWVQETLLRDIRARGAKVVQCDMPAWAEDSPTSTFVTQMQGAVAEFERNQIVERSQGGIRASVRAGNPRNCPGFGWRYVPTAPRGGRWEIDPVAHVHVREAYQHIAAGMSASAVTQWLAQQGARPPWHKGDGPHVWYVQTVLPMLRNPTYTTGVWHFGKTRKDKDTNTLSPIPAAEWIAVPVPSLIDPDLFAQVQLQLAERRPPRGPQKHPHLFRNGALRCGAHDAPMYGIWDVSKRRRNPKAQGWHAYGCKATRHRVGAQLVEDAVWQTVTTTVPQLDSATLVRDARAAFRTAHAQVLAEQEALRQRQVDLQHQIERWDETWCTLREPAQLTQESYATQRATLVNQLLQTTQALHSLVMPRAPVLDMDMWSAQMAALTTAQSVDDRQRVLEPFHLQVVYWPEPRRLQITGQVSQTRLTFPDVCLPPRAVPQPKGWDDIAAFLTAVCVGDPHAITPPRRLYQAYVAWCGQTEHVPRHPIAFGHGLTACGVGHSTSRQHRSGIRLQATPPTPRRQGRLQGITSARHQQVHQFLYDCCLEEATACELFAALYGTYVQWGTTQGHPVMGRSQFGYLLTQGGVVHAPGPQALRLGVRLRDARPTGLPVQAVAEAARRQQQTQIARFVATQCVRETGQQECSQVLYQAYVRWCQAQGWPTGSLQGFGAVCSTLGLGRATWRERAVRTDIRLKQAPPHVPPPTRKRLRPRAVQALGLVRQFLADRCVLDSRRYTVCATLYQTYQAWCVAHECVPEPVRIFGARLTQCGLPKSGAVWLRREKRLVRVRGGIRLAAEEPGAQAPYHMLLRQRHAREHRPRQPPPGQLSLRLDASAGGR